MKNGQFSDSYGAFSALLSSFTLVGLLLTIYYQATQLNIQREELKAAKEDTIMNRCTDIIYNQLEKINHEVQTFNIGIDDKKGTGLEAFDIFHNFLEEKTREKEYFMSTNVGEAIQMKTYANMLFLVLHKEFFSRYTSSIINSLYVLKVLIIRGNLNADQVNELRNLFFLNLGNTQIKTLKWFNDETLTFGAIENQNIKWLINIYEESPSLKTDFHSLYKTGESVNNVLEFYKTKVTNQTLENLIPIWKSELGKQQ